MGVKHDLNILDLRRRFDMLRSGLSCEFEANDAFCPICASLVMGSGPDHSAMTSIRCGGSRQFTLGECR
jgi:hypothetical protein